MIKKDVLNLKKGQRVKVTKGKNWRLATVQGVKIIKGHAWVKVQYWGNGAIEILRARAVTLHP